MVKAKRKTKAMITLKKNFLLNHSLKQEQEMYSCHSELASRGTRHYYFC